MGSLRDETSIWELESKYKLDVSRTLFETTEDTERTEKTSVYCASSVVT